MKGRLFIAVGLLGAMLFCTLVTADAADYRKEKVEMILKKTDVLIVESAVAEFTIYNHLKNMEFIVPVNEFKTFETETYLASGDHQKPDNRQINGVINDRREKERISIQLLS